MNRWAICLRNDEHPASLERRKLYAVVPDDEAEQNGFVRIVDESGEDYLYASSFFCSLFLPDEVHEALLAGDSADSSTE